MGVDNGIFHVTMEMQANEKEMPAMPGKVQDHPQAAFRDKSAAQYLEISRSTFRALVKAGKIPPPLKPSQGVSLWRREWLDKFLDEVEGK
ncbi:hypothetical protein BAE30_16560 [Acidithiobacillus caldus]|uniref:Helix-turn-helix domain-containing protein n=1 Tax=Acidithiobacillus caldus TaxID=33059 RepID=A0A1E7YRI1_9PROT|nr:hypothetical protein BAE30_16560 [Acidithiobacillus caldus]